MIQETGGKRGPRGRTRERGWRTRGATREHTGGAQRARKLLEPKGRREVLLMSPGNLEGRGGLDRSKAEEGL